jgi:hypothetical protein
MLIYRAKRRWHVTVYGRKPQQARRGPRRGVIAGIVIAAITAFAAAIASGAGTSAWEWINQLIVAESFPPEVTPTTPAITSATPDPVTAADRVLACQKAHGLSSQNSLTKAGTSYRAASCAWPPPAYADAAGFTEIRVTSVYVKGTAPSNDSVDRIVGPCAKFRVAYDFTVQGGLKEHSPAFTAPPGVVVYSDGKPYVEHPERMDGQLLRQVVGFTPARDELDVYHPEGGEIVTLSCVA